MPKNMKLTGVDSVSQHLWPEQASWEKIIYDLIVVCQKWVEGRVGYREEPVTNIHHRRVGAELLVTYTSMAEVPLKTEAILHLMKEAGTTFDLFSLWIMKAFEATKTGESGYISVNAYVADIWDEKLRPFISNLIKHTTRSQRANISIELLEHPFWEINDIFIENVAWLSGEGFMLHIDDYDILWIDPHWISRDIMQVVGQYCHGFKLDYATVAEIVGWRLSPEWEFHIIHILRALASRFHITAEWITCREDMQKLNELIWLDRFQQAPLRYQKALITPEL
jgi:hypothetical protein